MSVGEIKIDGLVPQEMALRAETIGVRKAGLDVVTMFALAVLAGAFIGLGAIFATTVTTTGGVEVSFGVNKLLGGLVFCLGLILVVVAGAELFTGNNLIVMAWAGGKVTTQALLRNWVVVYAGNFVGSIGTAILMYLTKQYTFAGGQVGVTALNIANSKVNLEFVQAIALGVMCNALVCLAVWLTFSARSTTDRILAIVFPIAAFVAAGFEHSVANMYFIPMGLFIKNFDPGFVSDMGLTDKVAGLDWGSFLVNNLLPVTIGNIIGGAVLVALVYWFVYLRRRNE
ncbi:MAG: formate transporter FocA [Anaerolineae bacterium]|nr:formate transporter FocA [Anaerolineae bacterium]